jgi:hypothetical protein
VASTLRLLLAGLCLLAAPAQAVAATTTLDFESGPATNSSVDTQYSSQGVVFAQGAKGQTGNTPRMARLGALAHSGSRGLGSITHCGSSAEFPSCTTDLWMRFINSPQGAVRFWAGPRAETAAPSTLQIEFYDVNGNLIGSRPVQLDRHAGATTRVDAQQGGFPCPAAGCPSAAGSAIWVHVYERRTDTNSNDIILDDLTYYAPDPGQAAKPTFGLSRNAQEVQYTDELALRAGQTASATIEVARSGPVGPLNFSADTPTGVTASFAPNPSDAGTKLTLTASAGAAGADRAPVVVHATRPSAGPGEQTTADLTVPVTVIKDFDAEISGMVITQGIQPGDGLEVAGPGKHSSQYGGVTLAASGRTYVVVYADAPAGPDGGLGGVTVSLRGFHNGTPVAKSPVLVAGPRTIPLRTPTTLDEQRRDLAQAFVFRLPFSWSKPGDLSIQADLHRPLKSPGNLFDVTPDGECATAECLANDSYSILDIPFAATHQEFFRALSMRRGGVTPDYHAGDQTEALTPAGVGDFAIVAQHNGWDVDATVAYCIFSKTAADDRRKCAEDAIMDDLGDYQESHDDEAPFTATLGYYSGPVIIGLSRAKSRIGLVNVASPIASVAHESFHIFGAQHTDTQCGGASNDQKGSDLVGDGGYGSVSGAGINRLVADAPVPVIAPTGHAAADYDGARAPFGSSGLAGRWLDLMSYCGLGDDLWIAPQQWTRTLGYWTGPMPGLRSSRAAAAGGTGLRVSGYDDGGALVIRTVRPTDDADLRGPPTSPLRLRVLAADGSTVADVPAVVEESHHDSQDGPPLLDASFQAEVPMTAAAIATIGGVQLVAAASGQVLAQRSRSGHAPVVRVLEPAARTGAGEVHVAWEATDADGDALTYKVDYSADRGRTWSELTRVLDGAQSANLPGRLLGRAAHARVRVRANDGLRETAALSPPFRADGAAPLVSIISPRTGAALVNDQVALLSGTALDDRDRLLTGRRLRWFAGHRRLGRGANLSVLGLPAGRRVKLRLVATDTHGRRAAAAVRVKVSGHAPRFVLLRHPKRLRRSSRAFALRVAASFPSRLTVSGPHVRRARHRAGPATRTIRVRLRGRPGKRVRVKLRLASGRLSSRVAFAVRR